MGVTVRKATIGELQSVNVQIKEFKNPYPIKVLQERLADRGWLGLISVEADNFVWFRKFLG